MYQAPKLSDFQRNLDNLIHEGEHEARSERTRLQSEFSARGMGMSSSLISAVVSSLDGIHKRVTEKSMYLIHEFVRRAAISSKELGATVKGRMENFATFLLATVPTAGLDPHHAQKFRQQYTQVFQQRLDGALKDIETGFIGGRSVEVKDADLQETILRRFYDLRHEKSWVELPVETGATTKDKIIIANICDQLRQLGFLDWKVPVVGEPEGMGKITAAGIRKIEGGVGHSLQDENRRSKSEKFGILDSPKLLEADIAQTDGLMGATCVFIDIDDFKKLNTEFSERVVDEHILIPYQKLLAASVSKNGFVYAEGGDEVVVFLPNATLNMAKEFVEGIRTVLSKKTFYVNGKEIKLKISAGLAHAEIDSDKSKLADEANLAMREAKKSGKDRTHIYSSKGSQAA